MGAYLERPLEGRNKTGEPHECHLHRNASLAIILLCNLYLWMGFGADGQGMGGDSLPRQASGIITRRFSSRRAAWIATVLV